jgi:hypothetical protein
MDGFTSTQWVAPTETAAQPCSTHAVEIELVFLQRSGRLVAIQIRSLLRVCVSRRGIVASCLSELLLLWLSVWLLAGCSCGGVASSSTSSRDC